MKYKEQIENLKNVIVAQNRDTKGDDLDFLESAIVCCSEYFDAVVKSEALSQIGRESMDGEVYRHLYSEADKARRIKHNACISALSTVNNLCMLYERPKVFPDLKVMDRTQIADTYIFDLACEYYKERKK